MISYFMICISIHRGAAQRASWITLWCETSSRGKLNLSKSKKEPQKTPSLLNWNQHIALFSAKRWIHGRKMQRKLLYVTHKISEKFFEDKCSSLNAKIFQGLHFIKRRLYVKTVFENTFYCLRNFDSTISHD